MIFYIFKILILIQLISAQTSLKNPVCEHCKSNEGDVGQIEFRIRRQDEHQDELRKDKYVSKVRTASRISFNPFPIETENPKIWRYGTLEVSNAPANSEFPPEVDPYNFGSIDSPPDPQRTIEQTTVKPWRSSTTRVSAELSFLTSPSPETSTQSPSESSIIPTTAKSSLSNPCLSCETEIDQVPICDNFNQTHKSICSFARWNCERRMSGLEERVLVHIGICHENSPLFTLEKEICPTNCPKHYKKVCDTSGTTHLSLCFFQMYNCQQRKLGNGNVPWLLYLKKCSSPPPTVPETTTTLPQEETTVFDCPDYDCPEEQNPICDSQGNIHENECRFAHARCLAAKNGIGLQIMADDFCNTVNCESIKLSNCSDNDSMPICGTDFVTYANLCHFQKTQCQDKTLDILFNDECKRCLNVPCPIIDPEDPSFEDSLFICDRNDETKSKCEFEMLRCIYEIRFGYNITESYEGRCEKFEHDVLAQVDCSADPENKDCLKIPCKDKIGPICGTDGITYRFDEKDCTYPIGPGVEVAYAGECCVDKCSSLDFSPVCDDNNVTYLNLCEFGKQRCLAMKMEHKSGMTISNYSPCENLDCELSCPSTYDPVCSNTGETFGNECLLVRAMCILNSAGGSSLSLDYKGECCRKTKCGLDFEPVCDSEGKSHINECVFLQEACLIEKKHGLELTIEYPGACPKKPSPNSFQN